MSAIPGGATDAFNAIVQKIDETLIQAEAHLRMQRLDAQANQSLPDRTLVPSTPTSQSERSCSPAPRAFSRSSSRTSSNSSGSRRSSASSSREVVIKSKAYVTVDKSKGVVMTSVKCDPRMDVDIEVKKLEKMINEMFNAKGAASTSSSSNSYIQF